MIWDQFFQKKYFRFKTEKINIIIKFRILGISLCTKFHLKQTNFGPNLPKKGVSGLKTEKMNITIRFSILELYSVPNFSVFDFSGPNLSKKGISSVKQKKLILPSKYAYSN